MSDRDCNNCLYATRNGGCASWDCNFISIADAEPKIGRWIEKKDFIYCSECAEGFDIFNKLDFVFCPNCGARMEE